MFHLFVFFLLQLFLCLWLEEAGLIKSKSYLPLWFSCGYRSRSTSVPGRGCMGGGGRGTFAQQVPFDFEVFVPPLIFFFFATLAPKGRRHTDTHKTLRSHFVCHFSVSICIKFTHIQVCFESYLPSASTAGIFKNPCLPAQSSSLPFLCADSTLKHFPNVDIS